MPLVNLGLKFNNMAIVNFTVTQLCSALMTVQKEIEKDSIIPISS